MSPICCQGLGLCGEAERKSVLNLGLMSNVVFPGASYTSLFLETPALSLAVKWKASHHFSDLNVSENPLGTWIKLANTASVDLSISEALHSKHVSREHQCCWPKGHSVRNKAPDLGNWL